MTNRNRANLEIKTEIQVHVTSYTKKLNKQYRECHNHKSRSQPMTPRGREKETENSTYKINIQMHWKHIDQLSLSLSSPNEVITMLFKQD